MPPNGPTKLLDASKAAMKMTHIKTLQKWCRRFRTPGL